MLVDNATDLEEVDKVARDHINFVPASNIKTVLDTALAGKFKRIPERIAKINPIPTLEYEKEEVVQH